MNASAERVPGPWNWRACAVGGFVGAAVLLGGVFVAGSPEAAGLRTGLTPDEVEAALGPPGHYTPSKFLWVSVYSGIPGPGAGGEYESIRRNQMYYREYRLPTGTVDVLYQGLDEHARVKDYTANREDVWGWRRSLLWAVAAGAAGGLAARATRRTGRASSLLARFRSGGRQSAEGRGTAEP